MSRLIELTPAAVREGLKSGKIALIDVREADEHAAERIPGALLAPLSTFDPKTLPVVPDRTVVLHCAGGKRSAMAVARCQAAGVAVDSHLAGGIGAWKGAGLPTQGQG